MSVSEERMLILKMLEEGKISSEEASRLLEALDGGAKQAAGENTSRQQRQSGFQDDTSRMRDRVHGWRKEFRSSSKHTDFDRAMEDFSSKAEKLGKTVAATTFSFVDKVVDFVGSFVDTNSFNFFGSYPVVEKTYETLAADGMDLQISAINGYINVKKHQEDKLVVKAKIRAPQQHIESLVNYIDTGNQVTLGINKISNISVSLEILLPVKQFNKVSFETSNGRIYIEDALSKEFEAVSKNGHIELMGVQSDRIHVTTKNARIQLSYIMGKNIEIHTNNSLIDIKHIKAENLQAETMNGRILVENVQNLPDSPEMHMALKTTNGGIKVNMDDTDDRGYKVKAVTSNGSINLLIPDMTYRNIGKQGPGGSSVEAESSGFSTFAGRVNIMAETSNGFIEVVK